MSIAVRLSLSLSLSLSFFFCFISCSHICFSLKGFPCSLIEGADEQKGRLFISRNYVSFFANISGHKIKVRNNIYFISLQSKHWKLTDKLVRPYTLPRTLRMSRWMNTNSTNKFLSRTYCEFMRLQADRYLFPLYTSSTS